MWTFSNSTWKGQLKNVQDEISRPLGSREIQKTKVETVLWDTLYIAEQEKLKEKLGFIPNTKVLNEKLGIMPTSKVRKLK